MVDARYIRNQSNGRVMLAFIYVFATNRGSILSIVPSISVHEPDVFFVGICSTAVLAAPSGSTLRALLGCSVESQPMKRRTTLPLFVSGLACVRSSVLYLCSRSNLFTVSCASQYGRILSGDVVAE